MKGYENIKAFRAVALTLKGYSEEETRHGLAWSCKVYCDNKKIGIVSNTGNGAVTACDVSIYKQVALVSSLKSKGYQLTPSLAGQVCTEPADPGDWFVAAISQMVDEVTRLRQLKRLVKTHLIIRQHSSENEFSFYKAVPSAASKARLIRQLGSDLICFMNDEIHGL
ncbi:hypothetical protein ALO86_200008 [Pseudomonas syringae pv. berberidis]|uniref:hypothetical protein n=1 Tax=Pseudomonas syringae group genomosp. 3 TaxID=251701 RepID=UPI0006E6222C|nr:hypothetical protein [Pseudomonas syringae group genomosp. 3]KPW57134.1 hypothetical protein ALO86_200008 [Pseudomonas syringae pv. berberidis]